MATVAEKFLQNLKPYVIKDMKTSGILASLTAAQAFLESRKGASKLTKEANNLFGIKSTYNGQYVEMLTTEYEAGIPVKKMCKFKKYPSWYESIADHSALFNRLNRYYNLRGLTNYVQACINVQADGYATDPAYAQKLIDIIQHYKLYEWDQEALGNKSPATANTSTKTTLDRPTLKRGDSDLKLGGLYVTAWQNYLNLIGIPCGFADGKFGKNTELAVMQFQESRGLEVDGIIGPETWKACLGY